MKHHTLPQGSPEWHAHRRQHFNASDAPAMLGCSPYKTRSQLLQETHTGLTADVDAATQRRFDDGHRFEAMARPLAEEIIGEDLYPVVGSTGKLSASFDGLTMAEDTAFEHKTLNDDLRACMKDQGNGYSLPKHYQVQMEQQLLVSGAERVLFMATKWTPSGEIVEERHCWFASDPVLRAEIIAGWAQFERDLAAYVPTEVKEMPRAAVTIALPALFIHAKGEITTSNMKEYGAALAKKLAEVRAIQLIADQDFSDAKESAKLLREEIQKAKLMKEGMLAETVSVGEAARMIDAWCEDMRVTALKLEQDVEREDRVKKAAMIAAARSAYEQHIEAAKADTGGPWIVLSTPDWASAIKSKRSFASMQDALDTMLANAKIAADESARRIRAALAALDEEAKGYEHLFADRLSFISKPADDVRALVKGRIAEHRAAEERRAAELAERERARIRAEEEARARALAAIAAREQQEREAAERRQREEQEAAARQVREQVEAAERRAQQATVTHSNGAPMFGEHIKDNGDLVMLDDQGERSVFCDVDEGDGPAANVLPMPTRAPAASSTPTLTLTEINRRLGRGKWSEEDLTALGFPAAGRAGASKLWHMTSLDSILDALIAHFVAAKRQQQEAA